MDHSAPTPYLGLAQAVLEGPGATVQVWDWELVLMVAEESELALLLKLIARLALCHQESRQSPNHFLVCALQERHLQSQGT